MLGCAQPQEDFPDAGEGYCCSGAVFHGPAHCSCWEPVFDLEQQPIDEEKRRWLAAGLTPSTRDGMCGDCAYRPNSPEKTGAPGYAANSPDELDDVARASMFFCHDGMRRPLYWVHKPTGKTHPGSPANYTPPFVDGIPYRADGTPGLLCAGWSARCRALLAADARDL